MNREVKSIFLLLIFFVLVVHGMIPHHHDEHAYEEKNSSQYDESTCHLDDLASSENIECAFQNFIPADSHHDCPHHFHNCQIDNLEFNYSKKSLSIRSWKKSSNNILKIPNSFNDYHISSLNNTYADLNIPLNKCFRVSTLPLRAPPRLA